MLELKRTTAANPDFIALVRHLDAYLAQQDGDEHAYYHQFNQIDHLPFVLVGYQNGKAVACGAIKPFEDNYMEVKRMYVSPESRNAGIAGKLLLSLEAWAKELGAQGCVLETGKRQPEAVAFYQKHQYERIPNYGQYQQMENSLCFRKIWKP